MKGNGFSIKKTVLIVVASLFLIALIIAGLLFFGVIHINNPKSNDYPVTGVDVSCYQGDIDWETLASQNIGFAYIKATEGSSYVDPNFSYNWTFWQYSNRHVLKGYKGEERYIDMNVFAGKKDAFASYP